MVTSTNQAGRTDPSMLDVVALGDAMVGFAPAGHLRLEQASTVEVWPTGAEANAAVLMARLGLKVGWFSKLPDHPLSRLIVGAIRAHGVDTSRLVWTAEGRVGTFFYERSVPPRPSRVWYDRHGSAFTTMNASDVDWAYLTSARVILMAGTAPALSAGLRELTLRIARETRAAGNAFALGDRTYHQRRIPRTEVVDAVGAGDAFAGGFLCGFLDGGVQRGLDWGGATGALACTVVGDFAVVTRAEVEELLASDDQEIQR